MALTGVWHKKQVNVRMLLCEDSSRVVRRVDPVVRQRVVHFQARQFRELLVPNGVLFREQKAEELQKMIKKNKA